MKTLKFEIQPYGEQIVAVDTVEPVHYAGSRIANWQKNRMAKGWVRVHGTVESGYSRSRIGAVTHDRNLAGTRFCEEMPGEDFERGHHVKVCM